MPFEIRADLPASLVPIGWMIGRWEGVGVMGYTDVPERQFGQEAVFEHDGHGRLAYRAQSWLLEDDGTPGEPLTSESGFWRVAQDGGEVVVELLLAQPTGTVEIYLGQASGHKIELTTDVVARTASASGYTAAQRLYGSVEGDLLWAHDVATETTPMRSYASARLKKV